MVLESNNILYDGIDCEVNCYSDGACYGAEINGPLNAKLTINCNSGADVDTTFSYPFPSCRDMNVYAEISTELEINIYNQPAEFQSIQSIHHGLCQQQELQIHSSHGVIGSSTDSSNHDAVCSNSNDIYSINGWKTVEWKYDQYATWALGETNTNVLYCGTTYSESCNIDVDEYIIDVVIQHLFVTIIEIIPLIHLHQTNHEPTLSPFTTPTSISPSNQPSISINNPAPQPTDNPASSPVIESDGEVSEIDTYRFCHR